MVLTRGLLIQRLSLSILCAGQRICIVCTWGIGTSRLIANATSATIIAFNSPRKRLEDGMDMKDGQGMYFRLT